MADTDVSSCPCCGEPGERMMIRLQCAHVVHSPCLLEWWFAHNRHHDGQCPECDVEFPMRNLRL